MSAASPTLSERAADAAHGISDAVTDAGHDLSDAAHQLTGAAHELADAAAELADDIRAEVRSAARRFRVPANAAYVIRRAFPPIGVPRRGDGHRVLVLPGFTASDITTFNLRATIQAVGCRAHGWRQGANHGPTTSLMTRMEARLLELSDDAGAPISLVGWSLGGVYARRLARRHPERVRGVITLGSPTSMPNQRHSLVNRLWQARQPMFDPDIVAEFTRGEAGDEPLAVPITAIWTRFDRVVPPEYVKLPPGPQVEHIEVITTHLGIGSHPGALLAVADRLTLPAGEWKPFRPSLAVAAWFPRGD